MQRFNVFCLCCLFEVFQTLGLVSVLFVAEVKGSQIVQSSWEVLVCCLFVVIMCFLKVGLKDGPVCFLIDQSILVEVAHVGQSLQVTVTACLLPHLQVFKCFSIEATLVKRSQPVQCFIIFLPVCLFVVFDGFLKVFVDNRALFVQYSCNPFGVRQLFNKFLCNISVRTEWNGKHQLAILAFFNYFRLLDHHRGCLCRRSFGLSLVIGYCSTIFLRVLPTTLVFESFLFVLVDDVLSNLLVLEGTDYFEDMLIPRQSSEGVFELFGVSSRTAKDGTTFAERLQLWVELSEYGMQVVHDLIDFCWPTIDDLADIVPHLSNHSHIVLFLFLTDLPVALQSLLDALQTFLDCVVVAGRGKPVTAVRLCFHFKFCDYKLQSSTILKSQHKHT